MEYLMVHFNGTKKQGLALIEKIFPVHAEILCDRISVLTEDEQRTLGRLLKKLPMTAA
jgi:DNA-binding MarR family transcriptional regulator